MKRLFSNGFHWSAAFTAMLGLVSVFATFSSPIPPSLSLGTVTGKLLYSAIAISLALASVFAQSHENSERDEKEQQRDRVSTQRHQEDMAASARTEASLTELRSEFTELRAASESLKVLEDRGVPFNNPEVRVEMARARKSAATIEQILADFEVYGPRSGTYTLVEAKTSLDMPKFSSSQKPPTK